MKQKYPLICLCSLLVTSALCQDRDPLAPAREEGTVVSITARVQAVDLEKREITLKGPRGNVVTLPVDKRVKRLDEVKPGDDITADYFIAVAAEIREPTEEEKASPLTVLETQAKAPPGTDPAAGGLRMVKVLTTVEGVDRSTQSVTIKGPRGNYLTARVRHPENLEKLRLGQTIVITYAEGLAVSLEKQKPKSTSE